MHAASERLVDTKQDPAPGFVCKGCLRTREYIEKLETRLHALEGKVFGLQHGGDAE